MDGATTDKIIEQVRKCPSGALSYYLNTLEPAGPNKGNSRSCKYFKSWSNSQRPPIL